MKPDSVSSQASVLNTEPIRTCLGCRDKGTKSELLRLVAGPGGVIMADPQGHRPGRGAYVHLSRECWIIGQRRVRSSLKLSDPVDLASVDEFMNHVLAD